MGHGAGNMARATAGMRWGLPVGVACAMIIGWGSASYAETIYFKNGRKVQAPITKRTDDSITVDWYRVPVTYWLDEIDHIEGEGQPVTAPQVIHAATPPAGQPQQSDIAPVVQNAQAPVDARPGLSQPVVSSSPESQAPSSTPSGADALIEEAMELTGIKDDLGQITPGLLAQFQQVDDPRLAELPSDVRARLGQMVAEALSGQTLYPPIVATFKARFNEPKLRAVVEWCKTPLVREISRREIQSPTPEQMQEFIEELKQQPPTPQRLTLVHRLNDAIKGTDLIMESSLAVAIGMGSSFVTKPGELEAGIAQLRQAQAQNRETFEANVLAALLFAYRTTSDEELEQYVQLWESDSGRWFNQVKLDAFSNALRQASEELGPQLFSYGKNYRKERAN